MVGVIISEMGARLPSQSFVRMQCRHMTTRSSRLPLAFFVRSIRGRFPSFRLLRLLQDLLSFTPLILYVV